GPQAPEEREPNPPEQLEPKSPGNMETKAQEKKELKAPEEGEPNAPEQVEPKSPEKEELKAPEQVEPKVSKEGEPKAPEKEEPQTPEKGETEIPEYSAEMEKTFQIYESSQQDIAQVFSYCDRVPCTVQLPVIQNGNMSTPSDENTSQKTSKPQEKVEKKPEQKSGGQRSLQSSQLETQSEVAEGAVRDVGMPCLDIQVANPKAVITEILRDGRLPTKDEMLRYLGLHPEGPPLPPAAVLSIVDYPEERLGSAERTLDVKGSSASRYNSLMESQIFTHRTESPQDSFATRSKSALKRASIPKELLRLKRYRWIVPSHGEVQLKVHFSTKRPGQFEQTLRFELVESKRQYELPCSGTGLYPSISQNPRLVFPQWRETTEADEIIFKEHVESTKQFHFGPLLCGKSREWYVLPAGPCTF
ncbi:HYDIN protein, partial [Erithacus rubecula]|nr:HYDIN protein [Erithacus rubecula]